MIGVSRSLAAVVGAGILTATGTLIAVAAPAQLTTCGPTAGVPNSNNNARGGLSGCTYTRPIDGRVWEDRGAFPDSSVGYKRFQGGLATVYGSCGNGPGNYYSTFVVDGGGSARSAAAYRC